MWRPGNRDGGIARLALALAALIGAASLLTFPLVRQAAPARASIGSVQIVYPSDGDKLPYLTRSFVFGSAPPGSRVSVNGSAALVASSGGWIAFIPFSRGSFHVRVEARTSSGSSFAEHVVTVADPLMTTPATPARVDLAQPPSPQEDMVLDPGDVVHLFIKASSAARVSASFGAASAPAPLAATSISSLNPSDKERILGGASEGGETVGGLYEGELHVPAIPSGSLKVVYTIVARDGSSATATAKGTITVGGPGTHRVGYIVLDDRTKDIDARPYGIVESDPNGGWLFFPPPRTPFEVTGSSGDYYRVSLGTEQQAWIAKRSLALAPPGTPNPRAQVQGVEIRDAARTGIVIVHMTSRLPFSVSELVDGPSLLVRTYGAVAATDFVSYGADRGNVAAVAWDQQSGGIATIEIKLRQRTLWGYHADWDGNDLRLVIKKPPPFKAPPASALQGLTVVIDPGHSPDTGAIGPLGTRERDVNLAISKRLAMRLAALGAHPILTRTANVPVGLYDRTNLAARVGADILISVHNNALPDGADPFTHHGFSVYYYQPQSLGLARSIHEAYRSHTQLPDYGLYYDNLALARPTEEPAVLTESAFIMWPPEEALLRDESFQTKLAATLADGMQRWAAAMRARELR